MTAIQYLSWDSDFLGFAVGRLAAQGLTALEIQEAIAEATNTGYHLLYVTADPSENNISTLTFQHKLLLADRKVTFAMVIPTSLPSILQTANIEVTTAYTSQLESLAWQSGEYSRFRLDPQFSPEVFRKMYSQWLHNSLNGRIAKQVLVSRNAVGQEQGLLTLGEKNGRADIGLLAVDQAARGQRIGQQLVATALRQSAAWGYSKLQVVTQRDNAPACHFYKKCGFQPEFDEHIYHIWLK